MQNKADLCYKNFILLSIDISYNYDSYKSSSCKANKFWYKIYKNIAFIQSNCRRYFITSLNQLY